MARVVLRAAAALCWALIAGCGGQTPPQPITADPAPRAAPAEFQPSPIARAIEALPLPPPKLPAPATAPLIPERAVDLIVSFEIGDPATYTRKYQRPVWPGAASGVTVGIGYDLGHQRPDVIALDWAKHPHHVRLQSASGITGPIARELAARLADIAVEYGMAREVFDQTSLVTHFRITRRVFGPENFDAATPNVQGALTSVVFNRGGAMTGPARAEMRAIRDECLPARSAACVATQIRAMKRLWAGKSIERGMYRRRDAEAALAEAA